MTRHRSHATQEEPATHETGDHTSKHSSHESQIKILSLHSAPPGNEEYASSLMAWPFYVFGLMMKPWQSFAPFAWMESLPRNKSASPTTESKETETEYRYMVELPGIAREQIALHFQNGAIMLQVEASGDQKRKGYHYQHSHFLRRAFTLPVYTDGEAITAELKDGVLTITIPKTDKPKSPKSRTIDIT